MAPLIRLRHGVNEQLKERFNCSTDGAVAEHIGIDPSQWSRVIRGRSTPGSKLSKLLLHRAGMGWDDLFEVVIPERVSESA